jgi:hypothetical protein
MSQTSFRILLVMAMGVALIATIVRLSSQDYRGDALGTDIAMKDLASRINEVGLISVTTADNTLTLTREDDGAWLVEERGGYPANTQRVQEAVLALSRLVLHETKTINPDRYHRLDLDSGGKGTQVFITTDDGTTLVNAVIGKVITAQSGLPKGGVYLRLGDDKQTWLAAGPLDLSSDLKNWIETKIAPVAASRISRVSYFYADGDTVMLERTTATVGLQLLDIPEGHMVESPYRLNSMESFLEDLTIDDIRPIEEAGPSIVTSAFETVDGLRVDVDLYGSDNTGYGLRFDASGRTSETQAEAANIKARTDGWLFEISDWKSNTLTHRMDDLVKPVAAEVTP